jgi:hypothetical protein
LKGDREGRHALAVSGPWLITLRWDGKDAHELDLEQYQEGDDDADHEEDEGAPYSTAVAIWGTVVLPHWSGQSTVKVTVPVRLWSERGETRVSLSPPTGPALLFAVTGTGTATLSLEWVADPTMEGGGYWRLLRAFYRFEK